MALLKVEILGSQIEINYEVSERKKLASLIENFKRRLSDFPHSERVSNYTIIFLAALKAEDQLAELKIVSDNNKHNLEKIDKQVVIIEKLNNEVAVLQDQLKELNLSNICEKNINSNALEAIDKLEHLLEAMQKKMKDSIQ